MTTIISNYPRHPVMDRIEFLRIVATDGGEQYEVELQMPWADYDSRRSFMYRGMTVYQQERHYFKAKTAHEALDAALAFLTLRALTQPG